MGMGRQAFGRLVFLMGKCTQSLLLGEAFCVSPKRMRGDEEHPASGECVKNAPWVMKPRAIRDAGKNHK
jgi:hypothetical protein